MKSFRAFSIFIVLVSILGCVTTKEYKARIADIDGLKKDNDGLKKDAASLEQKLRQTETEKSAVESEKTAIEAVRAKLSKELEDLNKLNQTLSNDNANLNNLLKAKKDELSKTITELRARIADKEADINAKTAEIAVLKKQINDLSEEKDRTIAEMKKTYDSLLGEMNQEKERALKEKEKSVAEMKKTYDSLIGEMNEEIKKGEISVTQLKDKLSVNLVEKILFDSGSAEIKKDGKKVLERVADILKKVADKQVRVEGHTDNVPIGPRLAERFPSNWELSTARATMVARYLQDKGLDPKLLSASGYSEFRPVSPNDTEENKAKNRRIEIALMPKDVDRVAAEEDAKK